MNKLLIAMNIDWDYLLIDEPFSNLDEDGIKIFQNIFQNWKKNNKSIIFSSHMIEKSKEISTKNFIIKNQDLVQNVI